MRKTFLIKPKLQTLYLAWILGAVFVISFVGYLGLEQVLARSVSSGLMDRGVWENLRFSLRLGYALIVTILMAVTGIEYFFLFHRIVGPLYALEKAGGLAPGDARGVAFATARMGEGAAELRDLVSLAWAASLKNKVGYAPPVAVTDVLAGKADPYAVLRGTD